MSFHASRPSWRTVLLASVFAGVIAAPALAQTTAATEDEERREDVVIVTATKRESSLQEVPFSIGALSGEDLQRLGAGSIEDIARNIAGFTVQNLGPGQSQIAIRGVAAGQIVRDQPGVKEQVGVYLDESATSLSLFTPDFDLFDLNRVEVLRGPQGTLFGAGSIGGTVRYITNQPDLKEFGGHAEVGFQAVEDGNLGGSIKVAANAPIVEDHLAVRVAAYFTRFPGFIDALRENASVANDVNDGQRFGVRAAATWAPTSNITITPRIVYQEVDTNGFNREEVFNLFANPNTTTRPPVTFSDRQQFLLLEEAFRDRTILADIVSVFNFGPADLTLVSSYIDRAILVSRDASALTGSVSVDLGFPDAAVLLPSNLIDETDFSQFSQEVRLSSAEDGRFQWVVGGFFTVSDRDYTQVLPTPGFDAFTDLVLGAGTSAAVANGFGADSPFNSVLPFDNRQFAFFGEASYDITERLTFTAGGRYYNFDEERLITTGGLFANGDTLQFDETSSSGFTPRFLISYDLNDNLTLNLQASRGFRLGGVNDPLNTPLCNPIDLQIFGGFQDFDDETLWNFEGGVKSQFGPFTFNSAVFYTDISNLQVTLDAGSCSSRITFNVPQARTIGGEFELAVTPFQGLDVSIAGTVQDAEFRSDVVDSTGAIIGGIADGNRLPTVPNLQISFNAFYSWRISEDAEAFFGGSFQHIGTRFTQPSDQLPGAGVFVSNLPFGGATGFVPTVIDLELDSYQIVNVSAGIDFDTWSVSAFINNANDENAQLSFDRERGGRARLGFHTNQPRTFGINVRKRF